MEISEMIKSLRLLRGLSQEELALRVGYTSRSTVAKVEAGFVDLPKSKIEAMASALGVTPSYLAGWDNTPGESDLLHTGTSRQTTSCFAERLRALRAASGMSCQDVADRLGSFSRSSIAMYERGEREPSFQKLQALADLFNVSPGYLLGEDTALPEPPSTTPTLKGGTPMKKVVLNAVCARNPKNTLVQLSTEAYAALLRLKTQTGLPVSRIANEIILQSEGNVEIRYDEIEEDD